MSELKNAIKYNSLMVKDWTKDDVCDWVQSTISEEIARIFDDNNINGIDILDLTQEDIKSMDIQDKRMIRNIMRCISLNVCEV
jgi:hypothetical protein